MTLVAFDHVNIKTSRLEELLHFYCAILGLESGPRPNFPFRGAWLYLGANPILHLVEVSPELRLSERSYGLEHFAFRGSNLVDFRALLTSNGVDFQERQLVGSAVIQLVFRDPDGNRLHVDFAAA